MASLGIEPVAFWTGMALVFIGLVLAPDSNAVLHITQNETYSIGVGIGLVGWILVFLGVAIGTSRANRIGHGESEPG